MTTPDGAITYSVTHRTTYRYGARMSSGTTLAHLRPREVPGQRVHVASVDVDPVPDELDEFYDGFGNPTTIFSMHRPHDSLELVSRCTVTVAESGTGLRAGPAWDAEVVRLDGDLSAAGIEARPMRLGSPLAPVSEPVRRYAQDSFAAGRPIVDAVGELCARIHADFEFDPSFSDVTTPVALVLEHRRGVCQDFAHLMLSCLRSLRLPARYVSGYLETEPPPGVARLEGADASHAWVSVHVPGIGWLDVDPTNGMIRPDRHITVAWGRDYSDVAPVQGVVLGPAAPQELEVAVDVVRRERP